MRRRSSLVPPSGSRWGAVACAPAALCRSSGWRCCGDRRCCITRTLRCARPLLDLCPTLAAARLTTPRPAFQFLLPARAPARKRAMRARTGFRSRTRLAVAQLEVFAVYSGTQEPFFEIWSTGRVRGGGGGSTGAPPGACFPPGARLGQRGLPDHGAAAVSGGGAAAGRLLPDLWQKCGRPARGSPARSFDHFVVSALGSAALQSRPWVSAPQVVVCRDQLLTRICAHSNRRRRQARGGAGFRPEGFSDPAGAHVNSWQARCCHAWTRSGSQADLVVRFFAG